MYKTSQFSRLLFYFSLLFPLMGCSHPKMLFDKPGLTREEFNRDKYDCVQESRVSWSGGGTGGLGLATMISAKSQAENQSAELFQMCMEARGYTAREVDDREFESQKNSSTSKNSRPTFGVSSAQVTESLAITLNMGEPRGVMVISVLQNSIAERAGIKQGDIILKYGNNEMKSLFDLQPAVTNTTPGTTVPIKILRQGNEIVVSAKF